MKKREILFKAKRVDNGEWIEGNLIGNNVIVGKIVDFNDEYFNTEFWYKVIPDTVCQFTGMVDNGGIKIFEYDTVIANCAPSGEKQKKVKDHKCVVEYSELHHGWCVLILDHEPGERWMTGYMSYGRNGSALRVIGNIHDVKELECVSNAV